MSICAAYSNWNCICDLELHEKLLELILELHAWSTSRPELESTAAGDILVDEAQSIINTEREQGMLSILFGMLKYLGLYLRSESAAIKLKVPFCPGLVLTSIYFYPSADLHSNAYYFL